MIYFGMFITILILVWVIFNQNKKIRVYSDMINEDHAWDNSYNLIHRLLELYTEAKGRLERIDKMGSFSSDDEVGFAFKLINSTIIELTARLQEIKELIDGEEEISK